MALDATRLADGCRHVFLDVGSNRGVHVRFILQGELLFPNSQYLKWGHVQATLGPRYVEDPTVCAFGFEPNPAHRERLQRLGQRLRALGRRAEFFHVAASTRSGTLAMFHRDADGGANSSDWGFSARPITPFKALNANYLNVTHKLRVDRATGATYAKERRSQDHVQALQSKLQLSASESVRLQRTAEHVPAIDLAEFVASELVGRRVPPAPTGFARRDVTPPSLMMKLDVEGGELDVLERLRERGVLCEHFRVITCELHAAALVWDTALPSKDDGVGRAAALTYARYPMLIDAIYQGTRDEPEAALPSLVQALLRARATASTTPRGTRSSHANVPPGCNTRFKFVDDETYLLLEDVPRRPWEATRAKTRQD